MIGRAMLASLVFTSFSFVSFGSPWTREVSRGEAPWLRNGSSSDRQIRRENFFFDLHRSVGGAFASSSEEAGAGGAEQGSQEISDLPWKRFEGDWSPPLRLPFLWPVEGGRMSSGFGPRGGSVHEGIDIVSSEGKPVRAVHDGRVVYSGQMRGYGNVVVVYHGQGLASVYAHNRENLVRDAQMLQKGQVLATVGNTGHSSSPHLHFELRRNGKALNPLSYEYDRSASIQAGF